MKDNRQYHPRGNSLPEGMTPAIWDRDSGQQKPEVYGYSRERRIAELKRQREQGR